MDSLDKLLADLDAVDQSKKTKIEPAQLPKKQLISTEKLLSDLDAIDLPKANHQQIPVFHPKVIATESRDTNLESLLSQVKSDAEQKKLAAKQAEELQLQQQQLAFKKQEEKRKAARKRQAEEWLKTLEPLSTEGIWFTDFAKNYLSSLEAAIDYLEASERASLNQ